LVAILNTSTSSIVRTLTAIIGSPFGFWPRANGLIPHRLQNVVDDVLVELVVSQLILVLFERELVRRHELQHRARASTHRAVADQRGRG
jgi:hypothetical protein